MKKIEKQIKNADMFSHSIHLNYKGEQKISTVCGGLCSIALYLALFIMFIVYVSSSDFDMQTSTIFYTSEELGEIDIGGII